MAKKPPLVDLSQIDLNHVVADIETIRRYNPQRYEMEHLTAICYEDTQNHVCVGYKDLGPDEFWVRGHFPGMPVMPGVIMCESAAQLASYYTKKYDLVDGMLLFGGLDEVRFRGVVRPGDRFIVAGRVLKIRRTMMSCQFQGFVKDDPVCEGIILGVALPIDPRLGAPAG